MLEYLKDWRAWIVVMIIIIVIVWIWVSLERGDKTTSSRTNSTKTDDSCDDTELAKVLTRSRASVNIEEAIVDENHPYEVALLPTRIESVEIDDNTAQELDVVELDERRKSGQSSGEHACLVAMQRIFNINAQVQVRNLPILKNPKTGRMLELDIYIPQYKVACEFHGRQHYEYTPRFHKNGPSDLEYQQWKDTFKMDQCDKAGIYLITVPYNVPIDKIEQFIRYFISRRERTMLELEY
jgi:hypothetical protein